MLWYGRLNGCGLLLPEDKQADICHRWKKCCGLWPTAFHRSQNTKSTKRMIVFPAVLIVVVYRKMYFVNDYSVCTLCTRWTPGVVIRNKFKVEGRMKQDGQKGKYIQAVELVYTTI